MGHRNHLLSSVSLNFVPPMFPFFHIVIFEVLSVVYSKSFLDRTEHRGDSHSTSQPKNKKRAPKLLEKSHMYIINIFTFGDIFLLFETVGLSE